MSSFPRDWEQLEVSLQADVETAIGTLLATVTALNTVTAQTNADINANPAAAIKDVAREVKTVARQLVRLSRLKAAAFGSDSVGD